MSSPLPYGTASLTLREDDVTLTWKICFDTIQRRLEKAISIGTTWESRDLSWMG